MLGEGEVAEDIIEVHEVLERLVDAPDVLPAHIAHLRKAEVERPEEHDLALSVRAISGLERGGEGGEVIEIVLARLEAPSGVSDYSMGKGLVLLWDARWGIPSLKEGDESPDPLRRLSIVCFGILSRELEDTGRILGGDEEEEEGDEDEHGEDEETEAARAGVSFKVEGGLTGCWSRSGYVCGCGCMAPLARGGGGRRRYSMMAWRWCRR